MIPLPPTLASHSFPYLDRSAAQTNSVKLAAAANTATGRKLRKAAGEFEAQLLSSLWKSMKTSFASSDDDDSTDPAKPSLEEWGIDALCNAVGKAGGLGIGKQIVHALESKMERLAAESEVSQSGTPPSRFQQRTLP